MIYTQNTRMRSLISVFKGMKKVQFNTKSGEAGNKDSE